MPRLISSTSARAFGGSGVAGNCPGGGAVDEVVAEEEEEGTLREGAGGKEGGGEGRGTRSTPTQEVMGKSWAASLNLHARSI